MRIADRVVRTDQPPPKQQEAPKPQPPTPALKERAVAVEATTPRKRGRPHSGNETITLRLSAAVLAKYRGTGEGWQARLNADLMKLNGF